MALALLFARLLLIIVLLLAGLTKLADRPGSQKALNDFGLPQALARPIGRALPLGEIVLAIGLASAWAWWAAIGTLGLLLAFIASISIQLVRGRRPACHCFGRLHSAAVGPSTLVRNSLLALLATLVICFGRQSTSLSATSWLMAWPLGQQVTLIAAVIAIGLMLGEGWLLLHTLRQQGRLLLRIEETERRLAQAVMVGETPGQKQPMVSLPAYTYDPNKNG
jgi:uncharacterized membrane protein YphA (DoxX/SURF4 family)